MLKYSKKRIKRIVGMREQCGWASWKVGSDALYVVREND